MDTIADVLGKEVKQKIEEGGDWHGVKVEDGSLEGTLTNLDVDTVEMNNCDIDDGAFTVTVDGSGDVDYKDSNSQDQTENCEVTVSARVTTEVVSHKSNVAQVRISVEILGVANR